MGCRSGLSARSRKPWVPQGTRGFKSHPHRRDNLMSKEAPKQIEAVLELRKLHRASGKTQREIAKLAGISDAMFSRYLAGSTSLSRKSIARLSQVYGLDKERVILLHALAGFVPNGVGVDEVEAVLAKHEISVKDYPVLRELIQTLQELKPDEARRFLDIVSGVVVVSLIRMGRSDLARKYFTLVAQELSFHL